MMDELDQKRDSLAGPLRELYQSIDGGPATITTIQQVGGVIDWNDVSMFSPWGAGKPGKHDVIRLLMGGVLEYPDKLPGSIDYGFLWSLLTLAVVAAIALGSGWL